MIPSVKRLCKLEGHAGAIYALAHGRHAELLFSGAADNMVAEWSIAEKAAQAFAIKMEATVYSLLHLPEKQLLIVGTSSGNIHIVDLAAKKELKNFAFHNQGIFRLTYTHQHHCFVASCADGSISVWGLDDFALQYHLKLSQSKIRDAQFSFDESLLCIAAGDGFLYVVDCTNWQLTQSFQAHKMGANSLAFHPNGKVLISGGRDAHLNFWNIENDFAPIRSIPAHNYAIYGIAFSPNGKWCATASRDKTVKIWDASTYDTPIRLDQKSEGHINSVNTLLWQNDATLVTSGDDRSIIVWKVTADQ